MRLRAGTRLDLTSKALDLTYPFFCVYSEQPIFNIMKGDNLSHEEVWDDSALQNSWDDALAEYKVWHNNLLH
jgi:hypothetical protein